MSRGLRLALLAAAAFAFAAPAFAQQPKIKTKPITPINDVSGSATYNAYCTVCHGATGKGDGPAAKALPKAPADLTQLASAHNGKFPAASVRSTIVGEDLPMAHGTRDMPMWGPVFKSADGDAVALRVRNLVDYIESIQAK